MILQSEAEGGGGGEGEVRTEQQEKILAGTKNMTNKQPCIIKDLRTHCVFFGLTALQGS